MDTVPDTAVLMRVRDIAPGDRIHFYMRSADYTVKEVETDILGQIRHRTDNNTRTHNYHPGELLWVTLEGA